MKGAWGYKLIIISIILFELLLTYSNPLAVVMGGSVG